MLGISRQSGSARLCVISEWLLTQALLTSGFKAKIVTTSRANPAYVVPTG